MESEQSKKPSEEETPFSIYAKTGLSTEEVDEKLQKYGPNEIPEKKVSPFRKFIGLFLGTHSMDDRNCLSTIYNHTAL